MPLLDCRYQFSALSAGQGSGCSNSRRRLIDRLLGHLQTALLVPVDLTPLPQLPTTSVCFLVGTEYSLVCTLVVSTGTVLDGNPVSYLRRSISVQLCRVVLQ